MYLDISNTIHIDFDPFRIILTFISVVNAHIVRYRHHPKQALGPVGISVWGRRNTVIYAKGTFDIFYVNLHSYASAETST